jgi:hypothetical protein
MPHLSPFLGKQPLTIYPFMKSILQNSSKKIKIRRIIGIDKKKEAMEISSTIHEEFVFGNTLSSLRMKQPILFELPNPMLWSTNDRQKEFYYKSLSRYKI